MENIFEGAEFGDKYRAVDGRMAVYVRCFNKQKDWHYLLFENHVAPEGCNSDGSPRFPASYSNYIIGKWENKIVSPDVDDEAFLKDANEASRIVYGLVEKYKKARYLDKCRQEDNAKIKEIMKKHPFETRGMTVAQVKRLIYRGQK